MKDLAIYCHVYANIEVLPVPEITMVILRQSLSLHEPALWNATVLLRWFHYRNGVIFQIVIYPHVSDPVELIRRFMHSLLEKGEELQDL